MLTGFEEVGLAVGDPFGTAFQVGAEEIAHAFCMFETLDIDGECREELHDAIEEHPPAETSFAWCDILEVGGEFKFFKLINES